MSRSVILLGAGGHARVLLDTLRLKGVEVLGYLAPASSAVDPGVKYLSVAEVELVNGVGDLTLRQRLYDEFKSRGYRFVQVIHPSAVVSDGASLAEGVQVMAGAVVQTGAALSENVIINTRASVDHDCHIGSHTHVAVGAVLAGDVSIGERVLIGAGSTVIQGIAIGDQSIVAAGAVVIRDVPAGKTVMGVPAR